MNLILEAKDSFDLTLPNGSVSITILTLLCLSAHESLSCSGLNNNIPIENIQLPSSHLLGQGPLLQLTDSCFGHGHIKCSLSFSVQFRTRCFSPGPHVVEHGVHSPHGKKFE